MSSTDRLPIPEPVARRLRQEAGFGCCRCGFAIYQYHHIVPWVDDPHYRPEDMMILCVRCHDEVTNGGVPEREQRTWKAKPFNVVHGHRGGTLRVNQTACKIAVGSGILENCEGVFDLGGKAFTTRLEADRLLLSFKLRDKNDALLLEVVDNVWVFGDGAPWDFKSKWRFLRLRAKSHDVRLELDARKDPIKVTGKFWKSGNHVRIDDKEFYAYDAKLNASVHIVGLNMKHGRGVVKL
jgi:hypothetical protein